SHSDVAAVHCMAEALGGLYDTPHGVANSIFLPVVTAFNAEADPARHARAAAACGLPVSGLTAGEAALLLVGELEKLSRDIGIPPFKSLPGVSPADFRQLARSSALNGSTPSNCREINEEDYLRLLIKSYES
ncbi:MAG: alcohol dehydrogenase, partial [Bacillota bacterium]